MNGDMLSTSEVQARIFAAVNAVEETEESELTAALWRVCAEDIRAPFDVPNHDNSAMDGYAARAEDIPQTPDGAEAALAVVDESFAGHPAKMTVAAGEAVKIMTGAVLPAGCDIVIPVEETRLSTKGENDKNIVILPAARRAGLHIRRAGEDLKKDDTALPAGSLLTPAALGLAASIGRRAVQCFRRPRVAHFSTGDEIRAAAENETLAQGEVFDSNRHTIGAMLRRLNFETLDLGVAPDNLAETKELLNRAAQADAIITSGGVSVGEADHTRRALDEAGEILSWKVAMKPGRPLAFGRVGNAHFFGLPGNPVSVMVCFYQFVQPALWKLAGRKDYALPPLFTARLTAPLKKARGRMEFQRGILSQDKNGNPQVRATGNQGSGVLSSMRRANCFIILPEQQGNVNEGDAVQVQMFDGLI